MTPVRAVGYPLAMAGRAAAPTEREDVQQQVVNWRLRVLSEAGYPREMAEDIARGNADLHRAVDLLKSGCTPELAHRILA
jgi:hypothetical protein